MSARRILGLEQTFNCSPHGKPWGNKRAQNGEGHILPCVVHPVGKTIPEVQRAYLAGFIDGDGAIMALLERHPAKRFGSAFGCGSKRPSYVSRTCSGCARNLALARFKQVTVAGSGWSKDQSDVQWLLQAIQPFARVKAQQIEVALEILEHRIQSIVDLQKVAEWADALAALNVRSRGRRQNTAAMIQGFVSRND